MDQVCLVAQCAEMARTEDRIKECRQIFEDYRSENYPRGIDSNAKLKKCFIASCGVLGPSQGESNLINFALTKQLFMINYKNNIDLLCLFLT